MPHDIIACEYLMRQNYAFEYRTKRTENQSRNFANLELNIIYLDR